MRTRGFLGLAAALVCSVAAAQQAGQAPPPPKPTMLLTGLGSHRHPIATSNEQAQKFFDQGVVLLFGFNHEEAYRAFEKAAELDPKQPMPHWGMALALGANYNDPAPEAERLKKARVEVEKALALSAGAPENERAYVEALSVRYSADPAADKQTLARGYNAAMKALSLKYPDDLDAATMYAESGMNLRPWKLYRPDGTPEEGTEEIVAVLESVLKRDPNHPGANHYYIHAIEASKHPERALPSATRLETLVPSAGHLVHMPAHIYIRTGDYYAAEKANAVAAEVDRAYIRETGAQGMYPVHVLQPQRALSSRAPRPWRGVTPRRRRPRDILFAGVLPGASADPMLEGWLLQPAFVALRFQKWDDIRKMEDPGPKLPLLRAVWLYARAMAAAAAGDVQKAQTLQEAFVIARDGLPASAMVGMQNSGAARSRRCLARPRREDRRGPQAIGRRRSRAGSRRSRPKTPWPTTSRRRGITRSVNRWARRCFETARRPRPRRSFVRTWRSTRATPAHSSAWRRA